MTTEDPKPTNATAKEPLQFSLRTLVVLTTCVALVAAAATGTFGPGVAYVTGRIAFYGIICFGPYLLMFMAACVIRFILGGSPEPDRDVHGEGGVASGEPRKTIDVPPCAPGLKTRDLQ